MKSQNIHCTAIILAAGSGRRMKSDKPKQFMLLEDKPIIWYSLQAVEQSEIIDDCVLVTGSGDISYVQDEIIRKYQFKKVKVLVAGGNERYESVHNGLQAIDILQLGIPEELAWLEEEECKRIAQEYEAAGKSYERYVFIHDGARPFLTEKILADTFAAVQSYGACVAGMPVKDTIKIADENGFAVQTPNRNMVWAVQTPQVFETNLITKAYEMLMEQLEDLKARGVAVTDDAFVAETMLGIPVKLVEASYENIKITTPEDIKTARGFLN